MDTTRVLFVLAALAAAGLAAAQAPAPSSQQVQAMQEEREHLLRRQLHQLQLEREQQRARAAERCAANRGVDCTTDEGLQEWLQQDRTRLEAVLDGARLRGGALPPEARMVEER